eukprot:2381684-Alexandrium_andersonii.AAC.1
MCIRDSFLLLLLRAPARPSAGTTLSTGCSSTLPSTRAGASALHCARACLRSWQQSRALVLT